MSGAHDLGGSPAGRIDRSGHEVEDWERLADAINIALSGKDQHRRAIESLPNYRDLGYYERWAAATEKLLLEKSILSQAEIDERASEFERRWGDS
jgi:hypothetical protein